MTDSHVFYNNPDTLNLEKLQDAARKRTKEGRTTIIHHHAYNEVCALDVAKEQMHEFHTPTPPLDEGEAGVEG